MSHIDEPDDAEQDPYAQPGDEQQDSAQPLDHRELDDAQSAGRKASEDLLDESDADDAVDG